MKDLLFLDAAIATLAPDIDLFAEVTRVATHFATRHGERIMADIGIDPRTTQVDLDGLKASMGVSLETPSRPTASSRSGAGSASAGCRPIAAVTPVIRARR